MKPISLLIILLIIFGIGLFIYKGCKLDCNLLNADYYRYLGNVYSPLDGGIASEFNEECLDNENRHCMLTSGITGKCVLNGQCMASFMVDHREEAEEVHKPYCTKPYSADGCERFCDCLKMEGKGSEVCMDWCKSQFHPYFR